MALPKGAYKHTEHENDVLSVWLENNYYKPEYSPIEDRVVSLEEMKQDEREPWALICPPPNAYGRPHVGNISGYAYMDAMARYQRMLGKKVLVLPGKDHAGLEGEGVFVREVLEKQKRFKFDMKREDFYNEMMTWMSENMQEALQDEKNIGLSADFDRNTFTLDPAIVETVLDTFIELYNDKKIYKGVRIINWDPKARTAVADNQIEYKESQTPFFFFKYKLGKPDPYLLEIRDKFSGKMVAWEHELQYFEEFEDIQTLPYMYGELEDKTYINKADGDVLDVIALGYEDEEMVKGDIYESRALGILIRNDGDHNLVVANPEYPEDLLTQKIDEYQRFQFGRNAGAHYVSFEEKPEDTHYTKGLIIGTVRPETIFADTAIACDPKDERYKEYVGKQIEVEFLGETKKLNFIEDYSVDKDFGTGLLKVTPAHANEDWEIALRHKKACMPAIQVIGYDLKMNNLAGEYSGLKIKEAREALREDMLKHGNLVYVDDAYSNRIAIAERTKAPIEPLLSSQWYLSYDGLKEAGIEMASNGRNAKSEDEKNFAVRIHPESMEKKFNYWMENLRDWAISRSLWWGYRLPVWYHGEVKEVIDESGQVKEMIKQAGSDTWTELGYDNKDHLEVQKECPGEGWVQDENVLDTWFSSGQWPFATLDKYNLMDVFFPTNVMVSGFDILENWISRMMMFSYYKSSEVPFRDVYLTGLVKGTDGQKMSKSKGNLMNMDEVREKYGTDAVRMVYYYQNSAGSDYALTYEKLDTFKKFINKIWNASKFVLMNLEDLPEQHQSVYNLKKEDLEFEENRALFEHIQEVREKITENIENFDFGLATFNLYQFFWHDFADVHIENVKKHVYTFKDRETGKVISEPDPKAKLEAQKVLLLALKSYMKFLHPFIPFVTERLWRELPKEDGDFKILMYSRW